MFWDIIIVCRVVGWRGGGVEGSRRGAGVEEGCRGGGVEERGLALAGWRL